MTPSLLSLFSRKAPRAPKGVGGAAGSRPQQAGRQRISIFSSDNLKQARVPTLAQHDTWRSTTIWYYTVVLCTLISSYVESQFPQWTDLGHAVYDHRRRLWPLAAVTAAVFRKGKKGAQARQQSAQKHVHLRPQKAGSTTVVEY
jgi:hypothetical protein